MCEAGYMGACKTLITLNPAQPRPLVRAVSVRLEVEIRNDHLFLSETRNPIPTFICHEVLVSRAPHHT